MSKRGSGSLVVGMVAAVLLMGCLQPPQLGDGNVAGSQLPSGGNPPSGDPSGDGSSSGGGTTVTCSADSLGSQLPVDVTGTTVGGVAAAEPASCGDGEATPAHGYAWSAPAAGVYRIAVTASFPVTLDVLQGSCAGFETGCDAAEMTNRASVDVPMQASAAIDVVISGEGGATGTYELTIQREADRCGDGVCEAGEDATSCAADCAPPPSTSSDPVCGDGVCEAGEDATSCAIDCGSTTAPDPGGDGDGSICGDGVCDAGEDATCPIDCASTSTSDPVCGDGSCDAGEDSDSCPSDCGDPSCDPDDPDCF